MLAYLEPKIYARVRVLARIWLNMSEYDVNMPEYVWIYNNRHGSAYVSSNT